MQKKKKKMKAQYSTDDFRKTAPPGAFESKIPVKARKADVKRGTQTALGARQRNVGTCRVHRQPRLYGPAQGLLSPHRDLRGPPPPNLESVALPRTGSSLSFWGYL